MAIAPASRTIVGDPTWLCHRYDPQFDTFHYRKVERIAHRAVPFLTDAGLGPDAATAIISRAEAASTAVKGAPLHFIFHSAFCGSTMLARALDLEGSAMSLSEPVVLNDLIGWRRRGATPQQHGPVLAATLAQLARPWTPGEAVVVKPSNVFNGLAAGALALSPSSRAVILTAPLPLFLASVARKGLDCRLWVRELLEGLLHDGLVDLGFEKSDYFRQTDLQIAAVGWLAQQALFVRISEHFGSGRVVTVDSEHLTTNPVAGVTAVARFFKLQRSSDDDYADHHALVHDSKSGKRFTLVERQRQREAAQQAHEDEIAKVTIWTETVAANAGVSMHLAQRLF